MNIMTGPISQFFHLQVCIMLLCSSITWARHCQRVPIITRKFGGVGGCLLESLFFKVFFFFGVLLEFLFLRGSGPFLFFIFVIVILFCIPRLCKIPLVLIVLAFTFQAVFRGMSRVPILLLTLFPKLAKLFFFCKCLPFL